MKTRDYTKSVQKGGKNVVRIDAEKKIMSSEKKVQ